MNNVILSLFPGIGGLDHGFTKAGFCVVQGPDKVTGGDIRKFFAVEGMAQGVIGGSPCQDYSALNRNPGSYSDEMLREYIRIVTQGRPEFFLLENVVGVPDVKIEGYEVQRFNLDYGWFSPYSRLRAFQFGSRTGIQLNPMRGHKGNIERTALTCRENITFEAAREIQGFPKSFQLSSFSEAGKRRAMGNAVPLPLSEYLGALVRSATHGDVTPARPSERYTGRRCGCGCGRLVAGRRVFFDTACRVRSHRAKRAGSQVCNA